ncbi:hypothetical protein D8X92_13735 [Listeria ivanovii]|uniref:Uncharacterized protein n=1 Tax=Listeria ivanovii subsp. londoniensis TaxID=202752 RepID=A0ABS1G7T2_LISIV|nr:MULTISPECIES: hypothetical protein [Listeria]MBK1962949.1 hypothetical protein [Listeria ivanovii subsp. londoniensis]MBM5721751.1 hypothetical protein [Listeria ivanovii]UCK61730.1 hypothetical protein pLIS48_00271c [Listeria ivanovii]
MSIREKSVLLFQRFMHSPYAGVIFGLLAALILLKALLFLAGGSIVNLIVFGGILLFIIRLVIKIAPFLIGLSLIIFLFWFFN